MTAPMDRRSLLKTLGLSAVALAGGRALFSAAAHAAAPASAPAAAAPTGPLTLPPLPYAVDALEPHIDAQTMQIHHDRHHKAYLDRANKALGMYPDLAARPIESILLDMARVPEPIKLDIQNHGGGHYNHSLFWQVMAPGKGGAATGEVGKLIDAGFGSFDKFRETLTNAAVSRFGSGWGWLILNREGKIQVTSTANQDCPLMNGQYPLLGVDVWEHAYYLKYQNKRADYLAAWFNVVNWDAVNARLAAGRKALKG